MRDSVIAVLESLNWPGGLSGTSSDDATPLSNLLSVLAAVQSVSSDLTSFLDMGHHCSQ